jgi:TIR domain
MATLFLTYKYEDKKIAKGLQSELKSLGHAVRNNVKQYGSQWLDAVMRVLVDSDAVVAIITEPSPKSSYLISHIGAARALSKTDKKTLLLPVIVGDIEIPKLVLDLSIIRAHDRNNLTLPACDIDKSIRRHLPQIDVPKLFISHRHKDTEIASALVDVLKSAFVVSPTDIRCTSVPPCRLPVGEDTTDRLKRELKGAQGVIGILTPNTRESSYVLFELGGAWAHNILPCLMLAHGASVADIPDPLRGINALSLEDVRDCHQLIDDLEVKTTLKRKTGVGSDVAERIRRLVETARRNTSNDPFNDRFTSNDGLKYSLFLGAGTVPELP